VNLGIFIIASCLSLSMLIVFLVQATVCGVSSVKAQRGQIAGAAEPLLANSIPATNVSCLQAALDGMAQVPENSPGTSWMLLGT
jgi:hypothetical protein